MVKNYETFIFIDRNNYTNLIELGLTDEQISKELFRTVNSYSNTDCKLSEISKHFVLRLNKELNDLLLNSPTSSCQSCNVSRSEEEYINHSLNSFLKEGKEIDCENEKYYELLSTYRDSEYVDSYVTLIIVEKGLISNLAKNKNNFVSFILNIFSHQYSNKVLTYYILKLYLKYKFDDSWFKLFQARVI